MTNIIHIGTGHVFTTVLKFEKAVQIMNCLNNAMENTGRESRFTVATPVEIGYCSCPVELMHRQAVGERTNLY
jgi:hypothetical protein